MSNRRQFFEALAQNARGLAGEVSGRPAVSPGDLRGWHDSLIADVVPQLLAPLERVEPSARDAFERELLRRFPSGARLADIARAVASSTQRNPDVVFGACRELFLRLAEEWLCVPANLDSLVRRERQRAQPNR